MTTEVLINKIKKVNSKCNGDYAKVLYWTYYGGDYKSITKLEVGTNKSWYTAEQAREYIKKLKACYRFIKKYRKYIGGTR